MALLTPRTQDGQDMLARMVRMAESSEMQTLVRSALPNNGETFEVISRKGLDSLRQDKTIYTADWGTEGQ